MIRKLDCENDEPDVFVSALLDHELGEWVGWATVSEPCGVPLTLKLRKHHDVFQMSLA